MNLPEWTQDQRPAEVRVRCQWLIWAPCVWAICRGGSFVFSVSTTLCGREVPGLHTGLKVGSDNGLVQWHNDLFLLVSDDFLYLSHCSDYLIQITAACLTTPRCTRLQLSLPSLCTSMTTVTWRLVKGLSVYKVCFQEKVTNQICTIWQTLQNWICIFHEKHYSCDSLQHCFSFCCWSVLSMDESWPVAMHKIYFSRQKDRGETKHISYASVCFVSWETGFFHPGKLILSS